MMIKSPEIGVSSTFHFTCYCYCNYMSRRLHYDRTRRWQIYMKLLENTSSILKTKKLFYMKFDQVHVLRCFHIKLPCSHALKKYRKFDFQRSFSRTMNSRKYSFRYSSMGNFMDSIVLKRDKRLNMNDFLK